MKLKVKLWGVRGSLPAPITPDAMMARLENVLTQFQRQNGIAPKAFLQTLNTHTTRGYGGNTSCAEVSFGQDRLIIDGGSGIRAFSDQIAQTSNNTSEYHIYFTHFHWDHLIGLPFFTPLYTKGKTVHFYSVDGELEKSLHAVFKKPNFPVPFELIAPQVRIHKVAPREAFAIGAIRVTPYQLDHPDPCWGVRIEAGGKSIAWAVDHEGVRHSPEQLGPDLDLFRSADLMVYDAQYSFGEALEKLNWGHSSAPIGIDLALREGVKRAIFVHHDPSASDEQIFEAEKQSRQYFDELMKQKVRSDEPLPRLQWSFGVEGEVVEV